MICNFLWNSLNKLLLLVVKPQFRVLNHTSIVYRGSGNWDTIEFMFNGGGYRGLTPNDESRDSNKGFILVQAFALV